MTHVVILDPSPPERLDRFRELLPEGWTLSAARSRGGEDQRAAAAAADFLVVGDAPITAALLEGTGVRAVHKWGAGYDNIDLEAARQSGVRVLRTTGSNAVAVAETALGLLLALNRNLVRGDRAVRAGRWPKGELASSSRRLSERTVGIVGMGAVGTVLARLLAGFGCPILYTKRQPLDASEEARLASRFLPLDELLAESDAVVLSCELNASTRGLIDARRLGLMRRDAILVNVARGGIVVEADLAAALRDGRLRGAALDVFATEPVEPGNPLLALDEVVVTPHIAAVSADSFQPTVERMIRNLVALAEGREPDAIDVLV